MHKIDELQRCSQDALQHVFWHRGFFFLASFLHLSLHFCADFEFFLQFFIVHFFFFPLTLSARLSQFFDGHLGEASHVFLQVLLVCLHAFWHAALFGSFLHGFLHWL